MAGRLPHDHLHQQGANATGAARTISFTVSDGTNAAAAATKVIALTTINNTPINTLPAAQSTLRNVALTLSGSRKISVADADAGGANIEVTLTVTNGTFTPFNLPANSSVVIASTVANVNTLLDGGIFIPTSGFVGTATIQVVTSDLGNTGPGGVKTDTDTLTIPVTAPPPPVILAQTITFPSVSVQLGQSVALGATASSGLPVTYALVSGSGTLDGAVFTPTNLAPVTIRATQAGNGTYSAASAEQTFTPGGKFTQAITFPAPADRPANAPAFALNATASSALAVTYTIVSGPSLISGNTITLTGAPGVVVIRATQAGNASYEAAASVTRSFNVTPVAVLVFRRDESRRRSRRHAHARSHERSRHRLSAGNGRGV